MKLKISPQPVEKGKMKNHIKYFKTLFNQKFKSIDFNFENLPLSKGFKGRLGISTQYF